MKARLLLILVLVSSSFFTQTDKRRVMASAGRIAKNLQPSPFGTNYIMSYTLGEPFIYVNTPLGYASTRVCNGFQQPDALVPLATGRAYCGETLRSPPKYQPDHLAYAPPHGTDCVQINKEL